MGVTIKILISGLVFFRHYLKSVILTRKLRVESKPLC